MFNFSCRHLNGLHGRKCFQCLNSTYSTETHSKQCFKLLLVVSCIMPGTWALSRYISKLALGLNQMEMQRMLWVCPNQKTDRKVKPSEPFYKQLVAKNSLQDRPVSSAGQSVVLITPRSRVRSPYGPSYASYVYSIQLHFKPAITVCLDANTILTKSSLTSYWPKSLQQSQTPSSISTSNWPKYLQNGETPSCTFTSNSLKYLQSSQTPSCTSIMLLITLSYEILPASTEP